MRVIRILAVCALGATCGHDSPVAPAPPTDHTTEQFAALADAITDAQVWLLPVAQRDVTADAIVRRFTDLATSLARSDTNGLVAYVAAARHELEAGPTDQPREHYIELAALGLVLDDAEGIIQGRFRPVLYTPVPTSQGSLSEPKSDRNQP